MRSLLLIIVIACIILLPCGSHGQEKADYIFYESENYLCRFEAPENWKFDLDNAQLDDYSAALFPDTNEYYNSNVIIYIWIFGTKDYSYDKFVTADSISYIKENPKIVFKKADSVLTETNQYVLYYETTDPGAEYKLAFVGYIPAGNEIIVYEMNISDRLYYPDAHHSFREALASFSLMEKE